MTVLYLLPLLLGLAAIAGGVILLIARDRTRFVARFDLGGWRRCRYLALLPNFLQAMYDCGIKSPWPHRMDAVSAARFRFRVRHILNQNPRLKKRDFLRQHFNLWVLLAALKPFIDDAILGEQRRVAAARVSDMADSADRDRLIRFVAAARAARTAYLRSLARIDRQLLLEMEESDFLGTLQIAHAVFREHGYSLSPALDTLNRWQRMTGEELVQELPAIGVPKHPADRADPRLPMILPRGHLGQA